MNFALVFLGTAFALMGVYFLFGVFRPELRFRWGRSEQGAPLSAFSSFLGACYLLCFGELAIAEAYQHREFDRFFPWAIFPLLAGILFMGWWDNRTKPPHDAA